MTDRTDAPSPEPQPATKTRMALAIAAIIAVAAAVTAVTFSTEPTAERGGARRQTAMLAEVTAVEPGTYRPVFVTTGVVTPQRDIVLRPRVSGEIVRLASGFAPGETVEEGEVLLQVDPADYRHALRQRRGELRQAITDLEIEMGRQQVAKEDYEILDRELSPEREALVLRQPQLRAAEQQVEAARAAVDRAELDLQRTTIRAPFDAQVLGREVNVGSQVAPGDALGRLAGVDAYWVTATVPQSLLQWLSISEDDDGGSRARVRNRGAWPEETFREGRVEDVVGALDERTRMARILVTIPDPLAREAEYGGAPSLMIEEYVETRLVGDELPGAIRIDLEHLRDEDTVWVMEEGRLRIAEVDVAVRDAEHAYITGGLSGGERIVTSDLATVTDGARLRVEGGDASR